MDRSNEIIEYRGVIPHRYLSNRKTGLLAIAILGIWYYFALPKPLFKEPKATTIQSRDGRLMGAKIATDGQWRFPHNDDIPNQLKTCVIYFEDEYFYHHPGFNPISIGKAILQNLKEGKIQRGGSTLTQQLIRLSRKGKPRTYTEKLKEMILATRAELRYSKKEILSLYANNAPFGGNVVGFEAAAWRYYGQPSNTLSWAGYATLAVLPNAPSLIFPGKSQQKLKLKRNRLLKKLLDHDIIDQLTYELSIEENLPGKPFALPRDAPHLLEKIHSQKLEKNVVTSLDYGLQKRVNNIVKTHHNVFKQNDVQNVAVLVLDVKSRKILAYVGNSPTNSENQKDVDIINRARSTGSIMKPFLYSAMLHEGHILPNMLIADIPTQYGTYVPANFSGDYCGALAANVALTKSLNVPWVRMLRSFGLEKFYKYLKSFNLTDLDKGPSHYGLSLILGGAESNLWDLCKVYAGFSSIVNHYQELSGSYYENEFIEPSYLLDFEANYGKETDSPPLLDAGAIYLTLEALKDVNRPQGEEYWEYFENSKKIAWKTGTSHGFRDAWAIGTTLDYVVGVWVGNADGEGRPGLTGINTAAPVLFDVFSLLPQSKWFDPPQNTLITAKICPESGHLASSTCPTFKSEIIPENGIRTTACPYHHWVHVDANEEYRVNSSCMPLNEIIHKSWFVLPPSMEYYYHIKNPLYNPLPPFRKDCRGRNNQMAIISPQKGINISLPKDFDEFKNSLPVKIAHINPESKVYWYLDEKYLGSTSTIHEMSLLPQAGKHTLTVLDNFGNEVSQVLYIVD